MSKVLAIIGTAGRGTDASRLDLPTWNNMKRTIYRFVRDHEFKNLISGGSSFSDHLAVGLFNAGFVDHLTLVIPCHFSYDNSRFVSGYEPYDPASRLNQLHGQFSRVIEKSSLQEIRLAIYRGAEIIQRTGFHERNSVVAERADVVIAFTFGTGNQVADGGTADSCRKYLAKGGKDLWHVDLNDMTLHENARVS